MTKFKVLKMFTDDELIDNPNKKKPGQPDKIRKVYKPGNYIELDVNYDGHGVDNMKAHRMTAFGIIKTRKRPGRKKKTENTAFINLREEKAVTQ